MFSIFLPLQDKDNLSVKLNQLLDYPSPMWLLIFAEGTRLSEEKMKASQEFARYLPFVFIYFVFFNLFILESEASLFYNIT